MIARLTEDPRLILGIIAAASAAILAGALAFQYVGGLPPCQLCLYQRIPYVIAGPVALLALLVASRIGPRGAAAVILLCGAIFAVGTGIAVFHVGVEQHWWSGLASCGATIDPTLSFEELKQQLLAAPVVRCDEVLWSMFGISMAGYNALLSASLTALSFAVGIALWTPHHRTAETSHA